VTENCALVRYYASRIGDFLRRFGTNYRFHLQGSRPLNIGCPETSANNYHSTLRINPKKPHFSQVVHSFHQNRKGAHVTKRFKKPCSIGNENFFAQVVLVSRWQCYLLIPLPTPANTEPTLPEFL
jgi:hypothetical protein